MTHIFTEIGEGTSIKSLTDAIASAFGQALQSHNFGGDHLCSTSIVMDGYDFDGKTYRVRARVIIFDHTLAHDDIYKEIEKMHEKEDMQKHLMDDYYAAKMHEHQMHEKNNRLYELFHHMIEYHGHFVHLDNITMIAPREFLQTIALENGINPDLQPIYRQAHTDLASPTLGPGYAHDGKTDKAA